MKFGELGMIQKWNKNLWIISRKKANRNNLTKISLGVIGNLMYYT